MHVTCSNCGARYIVDPLAIGPTGRMVQCARCDHRWYELSATASALPLHPRPDPIDPDAAAPASTVPLHPGPEPLDPKARIPRGRSQDAVRVEPVYRFDPPDRFASPDRSALPEVAPAEPRRSRWSLWLAAAILLAVALGAVLVLRGDIAGKVPWPWRTSGLADEVLTAATEVGTREDARVDIMPAFE